ncbi:hypothetical protein NQ317_009234 [Molorchus minor]|uniref:COP9 signalosome complex subunit 3 N-terminal helical repeats domain-containing protein n=1 Tax=Molorchus minor TaxID=1323400 RepID=A0ABQ9J3W2_9CUCU|nr:hypothetical protein NQ317_009234 [Molorchus minor]
MASALEQFVNTVRTLSSHGNFRELCEYLNKSSEVLLKYPQHLDNVLETLDVQQHSLGILAVLCAKFNIPVASSSQDNRFIQTQDFILGCNGEQIRFAPDTFAELCHSLTNYLLEQRQPLRGILLLHKAISKLRLFDSQLTSIHADLCQLCLLAKCFKPALKILDIDITGICQEITHNPNGPQFDAKYFLLYYYYGGMIYLAIHNLDRAFYFFEVAITTPSHAVSHIMLEAYKKYILVSLLLHGKVQVIPKYTSQVVTRFIKPLSQPYHDLANAFTSNNTAELNTVLNKHTEIEKRQISKTINQKDGMVIFRDEPDEYSGPKVLKGLEEQLTLCMELEKKLWQWMKKFRLIPNMLKSQQVCKMKNSLVKVPMLCKIVIILIFLNNLKIESPVLNYCFIVVITPL